MQSVELQILLKALNTESVTNLTRQMGDLNKASNQASQGMGALQAYFVPLATGATVLAGALVAVSTATLRMVQSQAQLASETVKLSQRLDLSLEQTERLQIASRLAGTNVGVFAGAANKLTTALSDTEKSGKKTVELLKSLGIETKNVVGAQRDAGQVLIDVVEKLSRMESGAKRTLLATKLLGGDGAKELAPLISQFGTLEETLKKAGIAVDESLTRQLEEADKQLKILNESIEGLKRQTAARISPLIVPIIAEVTALVSGNRSGSQVAGDVAGVYGTGAQRGLFSALGSTALGLDNFLFGPQDSISPNVGAPGSTFAFQEAERRAAQLRALANRPPVVPDRPRPGDLRLFDLFASAASGNRRRAPSLRTTAEGFNQNILGLTPDGALRLDSGTFISPTDGGQNSAFGSGVVDSLRQESERRRQNEREILDYRVRMIELLAGPGGELAAAKQIRDLRIATAETEQEAARANYEFQLRTAELARQQRQEWRQTTGSIFDALVAGRSGVRGFAAGFLTSTGRTLFQNAGDLGFNAIRGAVSLPGQTNASGELNTFGRLLQGTPFGTDPLKFATDANTAATNANTRALLRATGGASGIDLSTPLPGILGATYGDLISDGNGITGQGGILNRVSPRSASALASFGLGTASIGRAGLFAGLRGGDYSVMLPDGTATTASALGLTSGTARLGNTVASAGALATAGFGIYSGVKQGGARGAVTAAGSGAGALAALLPLIGVSGPAAPILAAAALGLGLGSMLFPDPKRTRDAAIGREVDSRRFSDFTGTSYSTDAFGRSFDYNSRGEIRPIVIQINALDTESVIKRRDDIAEAVRQSMGESHPIVKEIQGTVIPAS